MVQQLFGSGSNHHGATVVAQDTTTIVTLEAHVEKNLPAPVFHLYEGLPGFVNGNNDGETFRVANRIGVGRVEKLEVPTRKFYKELQDNLDYYLQILQTDPDNFDAQRNALARFKEVVAKPTTSDGCVVMCQRSDGC